jgi:hypothetical protein
MDTKAPVPQPVVKNSQAVPPSPVAPPPAESRRSSSVVFGLVVCILLSIAGWLGYQYYQLIRPAPEPVVTADSTPTPTPFTPTRPSPTPIALHAGIGEYTISHPQTGGPKIDKVIFSPLDVKKGDVLHLSVVITSVADVTGVTGTLTGDSKVSDLVFTKEKTNKNTQTWATELTLPDSVWYNYILSVTAINTAGKTTVQVAPRSS